MIRREGRKFIRALPSKASHTQMKTACGLIRPHSFQEPCRLSFRPSFSLFCFDWAPRFGLKEIRKGSGWPSRWPIKHSCRNCRRLLVPTLELPLAEPLP
jgi:hypothetical protein